MWTTTPTFRRRAPALLAGLIAATALVPLLRPAPPAAAADGGGRIVFASQDGGDFDVVTVEPDGSGRTNLTAGSSANDRGPVWFGNSKFAFASDRDGDFEIFTMNADGTGVTQITQSPGYDGRPTWSPDGTKLAFVSDRSGKNQIHIQSVSAPGGSSTQRTFNGTNTAPSWGVTGGGRITFTRQLPGADREIQVMNADGTSNTADDRNSRWISPDRLTFQSDRTGSNIVYRVNVDGLANTATVLAATQPTYSPGSTRMAFIKGEGGAQELYVANGYGGGVTRLTVDGRKDETPDWSTTPITIVPRELEIRDVVVKPTGLTTWVTFRTTRPTDRARVELPQNGQLRAWTWDQTGPTKDHSLIVKGLTPGTADTVKVIAPKQLTDGNVVVNAPNTKTLTRKVEITGRYADVIVDGDADGCGEIVLREIVGNVQQQWGSRPDGDYNEICGGGTWNPPDQTLVIDNVQDDEILLETWAYEDDDHFFCVLGDETCSDVGYGATSIPVLADSEAMVGSAVVHVLPYVEDIELLWQVDYKVSYHA